MSVGDLLLFGAYDAVPLSPDTLELGIAIDPNDTTQSRMKETLMAEYLIELPTFPARILFTGMIQA